MTKKELDKILKDHKDWLDGKGGKKANLSGADLSDADLREAGLCKANLHGADLSDADLSGAYLCKADLSDADLREANLRGANLHGTNLREANLRGANLHGTNLGGANLLIFRYQRHQAYCTGHRLIIGCIDKTLDEWASCFEDIGKENGYTDLQIQMYGQFIEMCIKHAYTIDREDK